MELIIGIIILVAIILIIRLSGAWMLRIDEIIRYQKEILAEIKKQNMNK